MFVNLKLDKFNKIFFVHILLNINQLKTKQTYIERSSFQCVLYLWMNGSRCEGTLLYIAASHSIRQHHESMHVSLLDRYLMTRGYHYRCQKN
jgi:hypothetical protein